MLTAYQEGEIHLLKLLIELDESNYKYAVELRKHPNILIRLRDHSRWLKEQLQIFSEPVIRNKKH